MLSYKSDYIFDLASQSGINLEKRHPISEEIVVAFRDQYIGWVEKRDEFLLQYLNKTPKYFRVYLPYSPRTVNLSFKIAWYFDEIVIGDPLGYLKGFPVEYCIDRKEHLWDLLHGLWTNRRAIEAGYLLFASSSIRGSRTEEIPAIVSSIATDLEIKNALREHVYFGYKELIDGAGDTWKVVQIKMDVGLVYSVEIHGNKQPGKVFNSPNFPLEELFPRTQFEKVSQELKSHAFGALDKIFPQEIHRTIHALNQAMRLNATVLYDRNVDALIINKIEGEKPDLKRQRIKEAFNLTLPFVSGIAPEYLMELREHIPAAFIEFRLRMMEFVLKSQKEGGYDEDEIKLIVEKEIMSHIRPLEAEMKAAIKKASLRSIIVPVTSLGILAGTILDFPYALLLSLGIGGVYDAIKTNAEKTETEEKLKGNPFYFLWKAKQ
ncbi:MAG: hypothetical protein EPO24_06585 [Bacteroidetes bacterium]|nr:MAG: hypothetical protein EPO24_06585 [Bacteroidota bacterium]